MMAPPGYPKITSTPASSSARHRISAPESISLMGSHSPEVAGIERLVLQLVGVAHLVQGKHQGASARFDDVGRGPMPAQRFPVDPRLHQHLPQAVAPRRDRKSTRLNSSHSQISYAVFCLKKKQHRNTPQAHRAICIFYTLTGQFDQRGGNLLYATTPVQPITGQELLAEKMASRRLGYAELPLGSPGHSGLVQAKHVYDAILTEEPDPIKALIT